MEMWGAASVYARAHSHFEAFGKIEAKQYHYRIPSYSKSVGSLPPQEALHGPSGFNKETQVYEFRSLTHRLAGRERTLIPAIDLSSSPRTPCLDGSKDSRVRKVRSCCLSGRPGAHVSAAFIGTCRAPLPCMLQRWRLLRNPARWRCKSMCFQCSNCAAPSGHGGASLQTCAGCDVAKYCGADCQTEHRKKGHSCNEGQLHGRSSNYSVSMACPGGCLGTSCFNCAFRMPLSPQPSIGL